VKVKVKRVLPVMAVALIWLAASSSRVEAWAGETHVWIATKAVAYLPRDWRDLGFNLYPSDLADGATVPDNRGFWDYNSWYHWYHPSQDRGKAPDGVLRWYNYLLGNLTVREWKIAVFNAGVMSHYISDVANPMHTDEKSQETDTVHSNYEGDVNAHLSQMAITVAQLDSPSDVKQYIINIAWTSNQYYDALVITYASSGWHLQVAQITQTCLNLAVKAVASLWMKAIDESGAVIPEYPVGASWLVCVCLTISVTILRKRRILRKAT